MSTNMQIWEKVSTTDTRYTKAAEVGGQKITSLNGTAMIMKATEIFGPVGIGFGWSVMEERLDYIKSVIDTMAGAQSPQELKKIHDVAVRKLTLRKDTKGAERISLEWKRITDADKEAAA